ncbi:unnamed protein product [Effrenium voratum]|nr:unnamed protein product [Effrenium voratum]
MEALEKSAAAAFLQKSGGGTANLILCRSAVAGIGIGLFGCLLSASDQVRRRNAGVHSCKSRCFHVWGVVGSVVFGLASLVGLVFGSVSLATVVRAGSTLPANAFFSQIFGLRPLVRDDVLGTLVTISGIISFTIFQGWAFYKHHREEYLQRMSSPGSLTWLSFLLLLQVASFIWLCLNRSPPRERKEDPTPARRRALAATLVCSCSSAFMDLAAKGWSSTEVNETGRPSLGLSSAVFWVSLCANLIFLVLMRWATIYGCRRCDVLIFVPLNTTANIIFSVASGMICLSEYKSVKSWPGLVTAGLSMLCGIFMLVTGPAETMAASSALRLEQEKSKASESPRSSPAVSGSASPCSSFTSNTVRGVVPRERANPEPPLSPCQLQSRVSALSFVYLNRIHRRAARARSEKSIHCGDRDEGARDVAAEP